MLTLTILVLITLGAATLSGIAGLGGGTILIVALFATGMPPAAAIALHACVQLISNASRVVAYFKHVEFRALGWFLLGATPAPFLLAPWVEEANPDLLRLVLGLFVLFTLWPDWNKKLRIDGRAGLVFAGVLAGGVGMFVGATGLLLAPFYLIRGWPKEVVIGTLAVTQAVAHGLKITAFGWHDLALISQWEWWGPMGLAAILGTAIGRWLHGKVSESHFKLLVRVLLGALSLRLIYSGVVGLQ